MDDTPPTPARPAKHPRSDAASRSARLTVAAAAIATIVLGGVRLFVVSPERLVTSYTNDDSFYFFQVARNLARGLGPSFDGLEWTSGVTPVWTALLVPVFALVDDPLLAARTACLLSLVLFALALALLHRLLAPTLGAWPSAAAVAATLLASGTRGVAVLGMDYSCNWLLQVLVIGAFLRLREGRRRSGTGALLAVGLLVGLHCIQRPDTALLPVLLAVPMLLHGSPGGLRPTRSGLRDASLLVVGSLLVGVPYLVGSQLALGSPVTVSGKLKTSNAVAQLEREGLGGPRKAAVQLATGPPLEPALALGGGPALGTGGLSRPGRLALLLALAAACAVDSRLRTRGRRRSGDSARPSPLPAILGHGLAHLGVLSLFLFPYVNYGNWYTAPEALAGTVLLASALALLARVLPARAGSAVGIFLALPLVAGVARAEVAEWTRPPVSPGQLEAVALEVSEHLREELPASARIGVFNAGRIAYFTDGHVVNLDGLVNTHAFADQVWLSKERSFSVRFLHYVLEKRIEWFVDCWVDDSPMLIVTTYFDPGVRRYFELVESWPTDTTYAADRPGSYQLVHFDLDEVQRRVEAAGG